MIDSVRRLRDLGLSVIPLMAGSKQPDASVLPLGDGGAPSWKVYQSQPPSDADIERWFGNGVRRNVGIVTGKVSGVVVVESDSPEAEAWCAARLHTPMATFSARGRHRYFRLPTNYALPPAITVGNLSIEIKRDGQYVVGPGSVHPSGHVYAEVEPWPTSLDAVPVFTVSLPTLECAQSASTPAAAMPDEIDDGGRNTTLFREACRLRRLGLHQTEIEASLKAINERRCNPPLAAREVKSIAASAAKYEPPSDRFPLTESGDAAFFADQYADEVRFDHLKERWLVLDEKSGIWLPDSDGHVTRLALNTMRARQQLALKIQESDRRKRAADWAFKGESRARIGNLLALVKDFEPIADAGENWDAIPHLLGTPTGVVDLRTSGTRRALPEERVTMRTSVPYVPDAQSSLWDRTLAEVFPDGEERAYLQVCLGYTATGEMNLDKWFLPNGPKGRNGKGTVLGAARSVLGDYAIELDAATFDRRKEGSPFNLAKLPGRRFAHCSEAGDSTTLHHDRIKQISGGDPLMAGDKHQRAFEFRPVCKLWFSCNTRPKVSDESAAFWLRVVVIVFAQTFAGREDTSIRDALRQDPQHQRAILRWLVDGARRYYAQQGLGEMPFEFRKATADFQQENEKLSEFYDAQCDVGKDFREKASDLWNGYLTWAADNAVKYPLGSKSFYQQLASRFEVKKEPDAKWYLGIKLKGVVDDAPF